MIYLTNDAVSTVVTPLLARKTTRRALQLHAERLFQQPLKPYLRWGLDGARKITMPAVLIDGTKVRIGTKDIASVPGNIDRGLPRASGLITLFDPETGRPLAIMECAEVSRRRTAAVASLGVEHLGGAPPWSVAILGCGPIAEAVAEDLLSSPDTAAIILYDLRLERAQKLECKLNDPRVLAASTVEEALDQSRILITATTGAKGYLTVSKAGKKRLIVALSLEDADPRLLLAANKLVVDSFDDCNREGKPLHLLVEQGLLTREMVYAEFGEILAGKVPGRTDADEFIYLNPMGMAIEDIALASAAYELLKAHGSAIELPTT